MGEMADQNTLSNGSGANSSKEEVTITYETLYDLLKREKERSDLQRLDETFFMNVLRYLKDKHAIIDKQQTDLFSVEEKRKTQEHLEKVRGIIKALYEKRERKIVSMAIDKSRNKSTIVDNSVFLKEEKALFDAIVNLLGVNREQVLFNILDLNAPVIFESIVKEKRTEVIEKKETPKETKLVRFLHAVPKFVGKELDEYGPFEEEDVASLPVEIANVLITKGRVEEISED